MTQAVDAAPRTADRASAFGERLERLLPWAYVVLSVCFVVYSLHQPLSMNTRAGHDDAWFTLRTDSILHGDWLGNYDQHTLIKGPGFVYFLVLNHYLGTPLTLSLALTYLGACAVLALVVRRVLAFPHLAVFAVFAVLLLEPAVVPNRVIRDGLYPSLFLFVVAGALSLTLDDRRRFRWLRAGLAGLALGWLWITREEAPWILPGVLLLMAAGAWRLRRVDVVKTVVVPYAVFLLAAVLPILATSALNAREYGVFAVTDTASGAYPDAVAALDSIQVGKEIPRVPVSNAALEAAYQVSPALREVKPYLEGKGQGWYDASCDVYPNTCGELAAGWFGWALREGAASAGHFTSAAEANRFFRSITDQIRHACDTGDFRCRNSPISLLPVLTQDSVDAIPDAVLRGAEKAMYLDEEPLTGPSDGTPESLAAASELLGGPPFTRTEGAGFVPDSSAWVTVRLRLTNVYEVFTPVLFGVGLLGFAFAVGAWLSRRAVSRRLVVVAGALWVFFLSRLLVIAIVDATSAPGIVRQYLNTAYLGLLLAGVVSLAAANSARRLAGSRDHDAG